MNALNLVFLLLRSFIVSRAAPAAENLALRQQLAVFKRTVTRPPLRDRDRLFWILLAKT